MKWKQCYHAVYWYLILLTLSSHGLTDLGQRLKRDYPEFELNAMVDIGANRGIWSTEMRKVYPSAKVLLLEASPQHEETLKKVVEEIGNADFKIAVMSAKDGEKVEFYQGGDTGNSMFKEQTKHYVNNKPVQCISTLR